MSGRGGPDEELVYLLEPRRWQLGNSLRVVDWSPDSRRLLVEVSAWQYQSDVIDQAVLPFDAAHGTFDTPDVVGILEKRLGKSGEVSFSVKGFAPEGHIVIEMTPKPSEWTDSPPGCLPNQGPWLLNWDSGTLEPLADAASVRTYGKWMPLPRAVGKPPGRGGAKKK